jgi:hypothetical protein
MKTLALTFTILAGSLALCQPAPESASLPVPEQPLFPVVRDSIEQVPLFRPRVIVRQEVMIPKDPFLGGALSLVLPGTGQAYSGKWLKGIGFLAGTLLCYGIGGGMQNDITAREMNGEEIKAGEKLVAGGIVIAGLVMHAWSVIDGVNTANAHNRLLLGNP